MENLDLYNYWREVPKAAQKTITGGNLNGKTDINPMWRIKVLTEKFGPVGFGWYTQIVEHWLDDKTIDGKTEIVAWVRLVLNVKQGSDWSAPIEGIGGSKYAGKGRGSELNDEAFKMAETDALSVACKKLGIGADIYWAADNTKYTQGETAKTKKTKTAKEEPAQQETKLVPIGLHPEDINWRNWLVQKAAEGYGYDALEEAAHTKGRTIPADVWQKVLEAI
jgi:hypothetical protein